jgi:PKD repeat protein
MSVTNGGFETGDFTGWTEKSFSPIEASDQVDATSKYTGSYGWHITTNTIDSGDEDGALVARYQNIDLTDVSKITLRGKIIATITGSGVASIETFVDSDPGADLSVTSTTTTEYTLIEIDTSTYTGIKEVQIRGFANASSGNTTAEFYIDDITLDLAPEASFTADVVLGDPPLTVQFTDTSTGSPTGWSWAFDDGSSPSTTQNPEHIFSSPGEYHVVLTATNGSGSDASDPTTITVGITPVADFSYAVIGNMVYFTDTSSHVPTAWSWSFGDGYTSTAQNPQHRYEDTGTITVTLTASNSTGSDSQSKDVAIDLFTASIVSTTVSKGINDLMYVCQMEIDGHPPLDSLDFEILMKDHTDTDQLVFMGYCPSPRYTVQEGKKKTYITAYSNFWFLTRQYLGAMEDDYTGPQQTYFYNNTASTVVPTCDIYLNDIVGVLANEGTYIDITKYINHVLGGVNSVNVNGLTIHTVVDCDDWNDGTLRNKSFDFFRTDITIMDAIQTIREYISYYFIEYFYKSTNNLDYAIWAPDTSSDDVLHIPGLVTFEYPDQYVIGEIRAEDRSSEKYNKVSVRASPGALQETFTATASTDTFTLSQHGRAGSTGATVQHGVGGAIEDIEVTEHLSSGEVDWVTASGLVTTPAADLVTVTYLPAVKYFEKVISSSGVTAGTEKVREAPPVYDKDGSLGLLTQDAVDEYALNYYDLCQLDPNVYHITLKDRTDLRLMQQVKFENYGKVPSDIMRITGITYRKSPAGIFVDIQCTLDRRMSLKKLMHNYTDVSNVNLMERIVNKKLKNTIYEQTEKGDVVAVVGSTAIGQTDGGVFSTKENI